VILTNKYLDFTTKNDVSQLPTKMVIWHLTTKMLRTNQAFSWDFSPVQTWGIQRDFNVDGLSSKNGGKMAVCQNQ